MSWVSTPTSLHDEKLSPFVAARETVFARLTGSLTSDTRRLRFIPENRRSEPSLPHCHPVTLDAITQSLRAVEHVALLQLLPGNICPCPIAILTISPCRLDHVLHRQLDISHILDIKTVTPNSPTG